MLDLLFNLELYLFYFINTYLSNPIFDYIFIFFHHCHEQLWFIIIVLSIWIYYIIKDKKNRLLLIVLIPLSILLTDQIGRSIKHLELRQRPYMSIEKENIQLLIEIPKNEFGQYHQTSSSQKSFPSNHAANMFSICYLLAYIYNDQKKYFMTFAILIAISRIYVGVHYPLDVLAGMLIGFIIGYILIKLAPRLIR